MTTFRVGQKVVCIDNSNGFYLTSVRCPLSKDAIYTVLCIETIERGIRMEVDGAPNMFWSTIRFRPLVEKKTDISIFEKMLTSDKIKERI